MQTHTIDLSGNSAKEMPRRVSSSSALLMFIPEGKNLKSLVAIGYNKYRKDFGTIDMAPPEKLPFTDNPNFVTNEKQDVIDAANAWSRNIPWG